MMVGAVRGRRRHRRRCPRPDLGGYRVADRHGVREVANGFGVGQGPVGLRTMRALSREFWDRTSPLLVRHGSWPISKCIVRVGGRLDMWDRISSALEWT